MSTVGLLEAITSTIGEEVTMLAGFRTTRLTAQFVPETVHGTGQSTASSADTGVTITVSSGTFPPSATGMRFRITDGYLALKNASIIAEGGGNTSITLAGVGIGVNFTSVSWQVVTDAQTTMHVESVLDWPAAGAVFVDGVQYSYASRTNTTLDGVTRTDPRRPHGQIVVVAGASISDGETVTIDDGFHHKYVFEFDKNGSITLGNIAVPITNVSTTAQVRDALITAIAGASNFKITPFIVDTNRLELQHNLEGTQGNVTITKTVANAGFLVAGMFDGVTTQSGAMQLHQPLTEVLDFTRAFSSADIYRRSQLVAYATGEDLNIIGRNLGIARPPAMADDNIYRKIVEDVAYGYRGTRSLIENILTDVLGAGNWEVFEDETSSFSLAADGASEFPVGASRHHNTIYLRRIDNNQTNSNGKAFLDGAVRRPITTTTTIALGQTPLKLYSIRWADDPVGEKLIAQGTGASSTNLGATITAPASSFATPTVQKGDTFIILSGPQAGKRGTINSITPTTTITTGAIEGAPNYKIGVNFGPVSWKIVRQASSFRYNKPTDEKYIEFTGDTGTTIWDVVTAGGASEGANTALVNASPSSGGRYLKVTTLNAGETIVYRHRLRIQPTRSTASFSLVCRSSVPPSNTATDGLQWCFQIKDGAKIMTVGLIGTGVAGQYNIGFVNPSTGSFISPGPTFHTGLGSDWQQLELVVRGRTAATRQVYLYNNQQLIQQLPYSNAGFTTTSATELTFGCLDTAVQNVEFQVKEVRWQSQTNIDYENTQVATGSFNGSGHLVDTGANGLFQAGDVTAGRKVRIFDFTAVNGAHGNARGEWQISARTSGDEVTLVGPSRRGAKFVGSAFPKRMFVRGDPFAFAYPDNLGHSLVIESGPNAGTYTIAKFLNPVTLTDFTTGLSGTVGTLGTVISAAGIPFQFWTNVLEVTAPFPSPADDTEVKWHLAPSFPTDAGPFPYEIVDTATVAGANVTLRSALPIGISGGYTPLVETRFTTVLSAQVEDVVDSNTLASGVYHLDPFYLFDNWGYLRDLIEIIKAAGVIADFDSLIRDAAGLHIQG